MIMDLEEFKNAVETFISKRGLTPTAFGKKYAKDPLFVFQLRDDREPRSATRQKVLDAMSADMAPEAAE